MITLSFIMKLIRNLKRLWQEYDEQEYEHNMTLYAKDRAAENQLIGVTLTMLAIGVAIVLLCCRAAHGQFSASCPHENTMPYSTNVNTPSLLTNDVKWITPEP